MVVQKTKLLGASEVANALLSNSNMLSTKTVEPTRQFFDRERDVRASGNADKQQTSNQLTVGKRRRSVARLGTVILGETNSGGHGSVLRLTVLKIKPVLKLGDIRTLKQMNRTIRAKINIHTQHTRRPDLT